MITMNNRGDIVGAVSGFVVCASCGTRIKAERRYCLRCGAELESIDAAIARGAMPNSVVIAISAVLVIAVIGTAWVWWTTDARTVDDIARPVGQKPVAGATRAAAMPTQALWSIEGSIGSQRDGSTYAGTSAESNMTVSELQSARTGLEQALSTTPDDPTMLVRLGSVLERLGDKSGALARYVQSARLAPSDSSIRFRIAHIEGEQQQWSQAAADYRLALASPVDEAVTRYNLALALHKNGDDRAAIPEYERAIELAPEDAGLHMSLGISLEKVGRIDEAVSAYRAYLDLAPAGPDAPQVKVHIAAIEGGPAENRR